MFKYDFDNEHLLIKSNQDWNINPLKFVESFLMAYPDGIVIQRGFRTSLLSGLPESNQDGTGWSSPILVTEEIKKRARVFKDKARHFWEYNQLFPNDRLKPWLYLFYSSVSIRNFDKEDRFYKVYKLPQPIEMAIRISKIGRGAGVFLLCYYQTIPQLQSSKELTLLEGESRNVIELQQQVGEVRYVLYDDIRKKSRLAREQIVNATIDDLENGLLDKILAIEYKQAVLPEDWITNEKIGSVQDE